MIGLEGGNGIAEFTHVLMIPVSQYSYGARPPMQQMPVLQFDLLPVIGKGLRKLKRVES